MFTWIRLKKEFDTKKKKQKYRKIVFARLVLCLPIRLFNLIESQKWSINSRIKYFEKSWINGQYEIRTQKRKRKIFLPYWEPWSVCYIEYNPVILLTSIYKTNWLYNATHRKRYTDDDLKIKRKRNKEWVNTYKASWKRQTEQYMKESRTISKGTYKS